MSDIACQAPRWWSGLIRSATTAAYPQHALAAWKDDDRSVAMTLLDGEFVHADHAHFLKIDRTQAALEMSLIDA